MPNYYSDKNLMKGIDMHMQSESIAKLSAALCKAQGEIKNPRKESKNPFFRSSYADLASVIEVIKEPFYKYGLSYIQYVEREFNTGVHILYTQLMHESGEWIRSGGIELIITKIEKGVEKKDMQTIGSAITYARRYDLTSMAGIYQEDDDGNSACGKSIEPSHREIINNDYPPSITEKKIDAILTERDLEYRERKNNIIKIGAENGWSIEDIQNYLKDEFEKNTWSSVTKDEFEKLLEKIKSNPIIREEE